MPLTLLLAIGLGAGRIPLPGSAPIGMDYLTYDAATHQVWVPAGNTGAVDVLDTKTYQVKQVLGFPTAPPRRPGRPNAGPSSVAVGEGVVWIGNRGDYTVCAVDPVHLKRGSCSPLSAMPDGLAFLSTTHELWVTTPEEKAIAVLDGNGKRVDTIHLPGEPEGYAFDAGRGIFYTNLEDLDQTLAIDARSRKILATYHPGCGQEGPRGLAVDGARRLLLVACTNGVVSLDLAHRGKVKDHLETGEGLDNLDYLPARGLVYVASAAEGTLTVARVDKGGRFDTVATLETAKGARNAVVDEQGTAYVPDSKEGALLVLALPGKP